MRLSIDIESSDPRFAAVLAALRGDAAPAAEPAKQARASRAPQKAAAPAPAASEPPPSDSAAADEKQAAEAPAGASEAAAAAAAAEPEVTREQVANAVLALAKAKGRTTAVAVLEQFRPHVKADDQKAPEIKLPMIPKAQYGALKAAIDKAAA